MKMNNRITFEYRSSYGRHGWRVLVDQAMTNILVTADVKRDNTLGVRYRIYDSDPIKEWARVLIECEEVASVKNFLKGYFHNKLREKKETWRR